MADTFSGRYSMGCHMRLRDYPYTSVYAIPSIYAAV